MEDQKPTEIDDVGMDRVTTFVKSSSLFYLVMGSIGAMTCFYLHQNLIQLFSLPAELNRSLTLFGLGAMGAVVLLITNYLFESQFPSYQAFRIILMRMVGAASIPVALYLALISAVGEELLFRGAMQPSFGLIATAILFGLLHIGPQGIVSIWTLWAVLSGLMLGWLGESTGSLIPPLVCHFIVNATSLLRLRRQYKIYRSHQGAAHGDKILSRP